MHTRHPLVTFVGINSSLILVITITPDFLGITYKDWPMNYQKKGK